MSNLKTVITGSGSYIPQALKKIRISQIILFLQSMEKP